MDRESRKFDVRTMERFVRDGIVSREEYQNLLDNLPDVADKAAKMEAEFVTGVLEDEDEDQDQQEDE